MKVDVVFTKLYGDRFSATLKQIDDNHYEKDDGPGRYNLDAVLTMILCGTDYYIRYEAHIHILQSAENHRIFPSFFRT